MKQKQLHTSAVAYRRQKQIEDCLYDNLLHTPYQSISVSDLCRQVGISRKAFYNYYHDKEGCFCAIIDRMIRESMIHTSKNTPDSANALEAAIIILDYWKRKKEFFDIVLRNNLAHFLLLRNMEYVLREDRNVLDLLSTPDVKTDTDILACYMTSQITLVLQWYFRGFEDPTEEIAKKLLRILHVPMIQLTDE